MASGAGALAIAHRGDPMRHRESTLPAIAAAVEQGADLVEIDVRLTADGTVSPDVVAWARDRGMAACCWTVDDRSTMADLLRLGVNAMITNRIGMLGKVLDELDDLDGAA